MLAANFCLLYTTYFSSYTLLLITYFSIVCLVIFFSLAEFHLIRSYICLSGKVPDMSELTDKEIIRAERNSGVISDRVREIQVST